MERSPSLKKSLDDVKYEQYVNNLHDRLPQLTDPSDIDCQRWPWELLQNAKDTVVKRTNPEDRYVDVTIKYYTDSEGKKKLYFEHNGDQFTDKAITGLIWKFSAEKRNEQTTEDGLTRDKQSTGRFGTGFMTTHALSLTVDVSGSLFHDGEGVMRNVSVDFTLHREGPDDEAYKAGVNRTEREIDENMDKKPIPTGQILPTRFTYHLNKDASEKAARMGIGNVRANAAQTMLFCPSVRSITVINEENNVTFKITRKNNNENKNAIKETVFVEESSDKNEPIIRRFISKEIEEYSKEISSHWKAKDRNLRLHVAVEVDKDNNILPIPSDSPAVYCSLPLIGFESMSLPFYINSNDFEPATERTSLYLKKKRYECRTNEETDEEEEFYLQSGINWSILERSLSLYESVVDYLIDNGYNKRYNLINGLGEILNGAWGVETKNCLASRFILPLRNMLVQKDLVRTSEGYRSIASDVKFVECSKDYNLHDFYEICKTIYGTNLAIEDENENWIALKWGRFTFESEFDEKKDESENPAFPTIKYDKVAKYIEDACGIDNLELIVENSSDADCNYDTTFVVSQKLQWLNKFYKWIEESKITNLADKKIVPNRLGNFCSIEQGCDLKDASNIPTSIFNFMKRLSIDWDEHLLMEGVQHITLAKETKDNVVIAIKDRSKEIRDDKYSNDGFKLTKLLPLLMALPSTENGRTQEFYEKRSKILSILKTVYKSEAEDVESVTLELKAETWEDSDKWLMRLISTELANRKHLDVIGTEDAEKQIADKYCTSEWLSDIINFMFDKGYLHLDDITESESPDSVLSIIPNRYGNFKPINLLYKQGFIPDELLNDSLKDTGFDIKDVLLYDNFVLNEKAKIADFQITTLASKYNEFFDGEDDDKKETISNFLLHLVPEYGEQYEEIRNLYDEFNNVEETTITIIKTSELSIWKGAKDYMIGLLAEKASECKTLQNIGSVLNNHDTNVELYIDNCKINGLSWLNRLVKIIKNNNFTINKELSLIPDWYGTLHQEKDMIYDGNILTKYHQCSSLLSLLDGELWSHYPDDEKQTGDENITKSIVNSGFEYTSDYQNNTDEKVFGVVDRLIYFCSEHNSSEWRPLLKRSIQTVLTFFEKNESYESHISNRDDADLLRLFVNTYRNRKNLSYDFIYDAETKARISTIYENFTQGEIEKLIYEKEMVKEILANKERYTRLEEENKVLQKKIEELNAIQSLFSECPTNKISEIKELVSKIIHGEEDDKFGAIISAKLNVGEVPTSKQIEENNEAKDLVLRKLGNEGFDVSNVNSNYSVVNGVRNGNIEYPLVVKSCNNLEHRIKINPSEWRQLFRPNSMLWLHFGNGLVAPIKAYELFTYQDKITLSFDSINLTKDYRIHKIMEVLHYFNKVHLDLVSLNPNKQRANDMEQYLFHDNNINNSDLESSPI